MITVGYFSIPQPVIDKCSKQKISTDIIDLSSTIHQLDVIDFYRRGPRSL